MRLREHPAIGEGRTDILPADPRQLSIIPGYNVRDLDAPEEREELDELKAKVKAHGVRTALVVKFDGEKIWIIEGHKRHKVALELIAEYQASDGKEGRNIDFVPITAEKLGTSDIDRDFGLETSNSGAKLKPLQLANLIYRLHTQRGLPLEAVAEGLGKSLVVIKNHLAMRAMPENVKQLVRDGVASATAGAKAVKDAKNDPAFAAQLLQDAADEQKRLGKKGRATPKAIKAATERAKPKPPTQPKVEEANPEPASGASGLPATPQTTGEPVSGVESLDQLQDEIKFLTETKPEDDAIAEQRRRDAAEFDAAAPQPAPVHADDLGAWMAARPKNKIEALLFGFVQTDMADLAQQYAQLCREYEEANAQGSATEEQHKLCIHAEVTGSLRWPEEWESAKATADMKQVAA